MEKIKNPVLAGREIRDGDVFRAPYRLEWVKSKGHSHGYYNHAFEGILVVKKMPDGSYVLRDTWDDISGARGRRFTPGEAEECLRLSFLFNYDDVEEHPNPHRYYHEDDWFRVTRQHACVDSCIHYFVKKEAVRNRERMVEKIESNIQSQERAIKYAKHNIKMEKEKLEKIENGANLNDIRMDEY